MASVGDESCSGSNPGDEALAGKREEVASGVMAHCPDGRQG